MKAFELLETEDKWTRFVAARDKDGTAVLVSDADGVCFCMMGAVAKCYPGEQYFKHINTLQHAIRDIPAWNDAPERTHAEVVAMLKKLDI